MTFLDGIMVLCILTCFFFSRPVANDTCIFHRDSTSSLRGLAVFGIMLPHIQNMCGTHSWALSQCGYLFTGLFFFISGYGNFLSLRKQTGRNIRWLLNKVLKLYVPFIIIYWVFFLNIAVQAYEPLPQSRQILIELITLSQPNQQTWFLKIILLCFSMHWVFAYLFPNHGVRQIAVLTGSCLVYIAAARFLHLGGYWYNTILCYPLGMLMALKRDPVAALLRTKKLRLLSLLAEAVIFAGLLCGTKYIGILQILCSLCFSVLCYLYTMSFRIKTKLMSWIGCSSLEFYLIHILLLNVCRPLLPYGVYVYTSGVVIGSLLTVYLYLVLRGRVLYSLPVPCKN